MLKRKKILTLIFTAIFCLMMVVQVTVDASQKDSNNFLVWNLRTEPETWDPTMSNETATDELRSQMFESLVVEAADGYVPGVAEKWESSDEDKVWTFYLRQDAKWSDGKNVTAHDFEYAFKRLCDPKVASPSATGATDWLVNAKEYFNGEASRDDVGVKALDDYTLEFKLINSVPFWDKNIASYVPMREDIIEEYGEGWEKDPKSCISNGPFKMTEYQIGSHIFLEKNEEYWNIENVKLDGLKIIFINDANTSLQAYQSGDIDFTDLLPPEEIPRLMIEDPNVIAKPSCGTYYLSFNVDKEPVDNVLVRKAISLAIDRKQLVEQITMKGEIPATGMIPPSVFTTENGSFRELDEMGYPVPEFGIDPNQASIEEAKELLSEAGYPNGEGFPEIELLYNTNEMNKLIMEAVQQMLKDNLNINTTLRNEESSVYWPTLAAGDYTISRISWTHKTHDARGMIQQFNSEHGSNYAQWRWKEYPGAKHDTTLNPGNEAFDEAFYRAMRSLGTQRDQAWRDAEEALMADMPVIPLFYVTSIYAISDRIEGDFITPNNNYDFKSVTLND